MMTGLDMAPYRGGAPALTDLMGGQVQVYFASTSESLEYIKSGKVRAPTAQLRLNMQKLMQNNCEVFRTARSLDEGMKLIHNVLAEVDDAVPPRKLAGPFAAHASGTIEHMHLAAGSIRAVFGSEAVTLEAGDTPIVSTTARVRSRR